MYSELEITKEEDGALTITMEDFYELEYCNNVKVIQRTSDGAGEKYMTDSVVFMVGDVYYRTYLTMSGSYFSEFYKQGSYDDDDSKCVLTQVEPVERTIIEYIVVV